MTELKRKSIGRTLLSALPLALMISASCHREQATLDITMPSKYEGKTIELIGYADSAVVATTVVKDGLARFVTMPGDSLEFPMLAQLNVDGRTRAFYVIENGKATLAGDSMSVAAGTPLNDRLTVLMAQLDSVESLDDMARYTAFAEKIYNENKESPIGTYFGVEWLKYADPSKVDSLLAQGPASLRDSRRAAHYINFARLRAKTSPGHKYTDFDGENADGKPVSLSSIITPGRYTVIDFMASWCPWCIKDFPRLVELKQKYGDKGLDIVSVAVRDKPEDTRAAVNKHAMTWPVLYNTQKRPYDIYGFSGIPHYILIDPEGVIVCRGESLAAISSRLEQTL